MEDGIKQKIQYIKKKYCLYSLFKYANQSRWCNVFTLINVDYPISGGQQVGLNWIEHIFIVLITIGIRHKFNNLDRPLPVQINIIQ